MIGLGKKKLKPEAAIDFFSSIKRTGEMDGAFVASSSIVIEAALSTNTYDLIVGSKPHAA